MDNVNGKIGFSVELDNSQLRRDVQNAKREFQELSNDVVSECGQIDGAFSKIGKTVGSLTAAWSFQQFATRVAQVRGEFQQLEVAMETMLRSKEKANALMKQMVRTAATTPFGLQEVAGGAKQLLAYGMASDKVNDSLIRLGNIASGLSIPLNDIIYLYGTTMTQGRLYAQDMNQFMGRGIPLVKELANQLDREESEIKEMVSAGKIGFPEVEKVINSLTNEGGMFFNLMEKQSKTITGQISNIEDAFDSMYNEIGESSDGIINGALGITLKLVENYKDVGRVVLEAAAAYGTYKAILMSVTALQRLNTKVMEQAVLEQKLAAMAGIQLSQAQAVAAAKTSLLARAQSSLNALMLKNPYAIAAAAVVSLGYGIYKLATYESDAEKETEKLNAAFKEFDKESLVEKDKLARLKGELDGLKEGTEAYNNVKNEIVKNFGQYYDGLQSEIDKVGLTEEAYNRLSRAIEKSFGARQYNKFREEQINELSELKSNAYEDIQTRLNERYGIRYGSKILTKIRTAIESGEANAFNTGRGYYDLLGFDEETKKAIKGAGGWLNSINRAIGKIYDKKRIQDKTDALARVRFGIDGSSTPSDEGTPTPDEPEKHIDKVKALRKAWDDAKKEYQAIENDADVSKQSLQNAYKNMTDAESAYNDYMKSVGKGPKKVDTSKAKEAADKEKEEAKAREAAAKEEADRKEAERKEAELRAASEAEDYMNEYLIKYGQFEQKKRAIKDKYLKASANAESEGEKLILQKQMEEALATLDYERLKEEIDWQKVFGNLDEVSEGTLQNLKKKLIKFIQDSKGLSIEAKKDIIEAITGIDKEMAERTPFKKFGDSLNELKDTTIKLKEAQEAYNNAVSVEDKAKAISALNKAQDANRKAKSEATVALHEATSEARKYQETVGSFMGMIETFGIKTPEWMNDFLGGFDKVLGGLEKIDLMKPMTIVSGAMDAVSGVFQSVFSIGGLINWSGSNAKEVRDTIDRLTDRNEALQVSIEDLTDEIKSSRGLKSVDAYRMAHANQEEVNKNYLEMAKAQAGYHNNHHSWQSYWEGFTPEQMAWIRANVSADFTGDLFSLSPEEMKKLRANVEIWQQIKDTGKGGYGERLTEQLDKYIEQAGKLEEMTDNLYAGLTGVTFDGMYDSFVNSLMDMEYSAEDAAKHISDYFMKSMLSNKIGELYGDKLKEWWEKFGKAMQNDGTLDEDERHNLMEEYQSYVEEALKLRDEIAKATGYDQNSATSQDSTSKGFATASQDSVGELNGRFTGIQMDTSAIRTQMMGISMNNAAIRDSVVAMKSHTDEIRNLSLATLDQLTTISKNTKELFEINNRLARIEKNTDRL